MAFVAVTTSRILVMNHKRHLYRRYAKNLKLFAPFRVDFTVMMSVKFTEKKHIGKVDYLFITNLIRFVEK